MIVLFISIIYVYINLLSTNNIIEMKNYLLQPYIRAMVIFGLIIIISVILYGNVIIIKYYKHNLYPVLKPFTLLTLSLSVIIIFSVIIDEIFNPNNILTISMIPPAYLFYTLTIIFYFSKKFILSNVSMKNISDQFMKTYSLTAREKEIILLIVAGKSNIDISDILFISLSTVKNHINTIYKKLNIKSRYELFSLLEKTNI